MNRSGANGCEPFENSGSDEFAETRHPLHRIPGRVAIIGEENKVVGNRLRDDLMIERIAMIGKDGEPEQFMDVSEAERKYANAEPGHGSHDFAKVRGDEFSDT
jgi:hypothetical protein